MSNLNGQEKPNPGIILRKGPLTKRIHSCPHCKHANTIERRLAGPVRCSGCGRVSRAGH